MSKITKFKRQIVCILILIFTYVTTAMYLAPYGDAVKVIAYRYGSRGTIVVEIQRRLRAWGYYSGSLDGVYGYGTYTAVRRFQARNGLAPDGVAGNTTLGALGINAGQYAGVGAAAPRTTITTSRYTTNNQDVLLLARLINGEARGEPFEGQVAVGAVIMNRTRDPRFPKTIAGVIYQPGAFTATVDGQINAQLQQSSINAARDALNGWDPSGGALYYFNPAKTTSSWMWSRPLIKIIGRHRFCR